MLFIAKTLGRGVHAIRSWSDIAHAACGSVLLPGVVAIRPIDCGTKRLNVGIYAKITQCGRHAHTPVGYLQDALIHPRRRRSRKAFPVHGDISQGS